MSALRYCECGRELEKYAHLCSECAFYNRQQTMDIAIHTYLKKNREKHNARVLKSYHETKITRKEWKRRATCLNFYGQ